MVPDKERDARVKDFVRRLRYKGPLFKISALTHEGCEKLVRDVFKFVQAQQTAERPPAETDPRFKPGQSSGCL
jgi:GTP-binding protein